MGTFFSAIIAIAWTVAWYWFGRWAGRGDVEDRIVSTLARMQKNRDLKADQAYDIGSSLGLIDVYGHWGERHWREFDQ